MTFDCKCGTLRPWAHLPDLSTGDPTFGRESRRIGKEGKHGIDLNNSGKESSKRQKKAKPS